jgi:hypothetical protein
MESIEMKPIKYAILLLVALMAFSGTVEARSSKKRNSTQQKQREKKARQEREKLAKQQKEQAEKQAEARKKKIAAEENREREERDKINAIREKRAKDKILAERAAHAEKLLLGEYDTMAREARMSTTQRNKLVAMVRKFRGLPPGATRDNSAQIARLEKALAGATGQKKKNIAARLEATRKKNTSVAKSPKSAKSAPTSKEDRHKQIMGLLTSDQKLKWGGYKLAQDPSLTFKGVTLTDKQVKQIRTICDTAAKGLPDEAAPVSKTATMTRKTLLKRVKVQIKYEVLTPAQRSAAK